MPSKKQRRRREKGRRHEYEYVYVDDDGREVEIDPASVRDERQAAKPSSGKRSGARSATAQRRSARRIEPPSWRRAFKRAAIFAPFMFLTLILLNGNSAASGSLIMTLWMLVMFVPFTYLIDRVMYRRFGDAQAETGDAPRSKTAR